jgi:hypothetical protein
MTIWTTYIIILLLALTFGVYHFLIRGEIQDRLRSFFGVFSWEAVITCFASGALSRSRLVNLTPAARSFRRGA